MLLRPGKPVEVTTAGQLLDVRAEFTVGDSKMLVVNVFDRYVIYDVAKQTLEGLPLKAVQGKLRLQILVDRSSLEVCGNDGRVFITTPLAVGPNSRSVGVSCDVGEARLDHLDIFELKSIWE